MRTLRLKVGASTERDIVNAVNQIISRMGMAGTTAERPAEATTGWPFFDTTLGQPIWWNGSDWVDATGAVV